MAEWIGSPNYSVGRGGKSIEMIVCHWIVGDVPAADAVFTKASSQTSAHYAVGDGVVHQYVIEPNTAGRTITAQADLTSTYRRPMILKAELI